MRHAFFLSFFALAIVIGIHAQEIPRTQKTAPVPINEVKPLYPAGAYPRNVSGVVEVSAVVLPDGTVGDVTVTRPLHPDADQEAIRAVKQWRFKPGTLDGKPVSATVSLQLSFKVPDEPDVYRVQDGANQPTVLKKVKAEYPEDAQKAGVTGTVVLEGVVQKDGSVVGIIVKQKVDPRIDKAAIAAFSQWQFTPGDLGGKPVPVIVQIEMGFNLK